jgi:catechol-2,3-dioxygenase
VVRSYPGALFLSAGGYYHQLGLNPWAGERAAEDDGIVTRDPWGMQMRVGIAGDAA